MGYYPVHLKIDGRRAVIAGGGAVAARKCAGLLAAGAVVTVVAPSLCPDLAELLRQGAISHHSREFRTGDLAGAILAFAATDDPAVNREVAEEARRVGVLVDVVDAPPLSSFISPAVVRRDDLLLTVSTGGRSPSLAARVREELALRYGPEYGEAARLLGAVREKLLTPPAKRAYNKQIFDELLNHDLLRLLKDRAWTDIDRLLLLVCGPGFSLAELGIPERDSA